MRQDRRPSFLRELFAERQVYVRSGPASGYVVLSRSLQIGVTLGVAGLILWLAMASYASIANHLDTLAQRHELARLEGVNRSLRAAAEAAGANEELRLAAGRVPALTAELEAAKAARERALSLAAAAAGEAEDLRRELALAQDRIAELGALDGAAAALAIKADAADTVAAEAQLHAATARIAEVSQERDRLLALSETQADEMATLRGQLKAAEAEITRLEAVAEADRATEAALDASSR